MSPTLRWVWIAAMRRARHCALLISVLLVIQGCAATRSLTGPDPADQDVRVPAVSYRSVLNDRRDSAPVEPSPWTVRDPSRSGKEKP